MKLQSKINKLLIAIRMKGIDIKVDTIQFYSEKKEKYCSIYKVYIKEWVENRKGEEIQKYILQIDCTSKIELLKYLINKYKELQEGEANE